MRHRLLAVVAVFISCTSLAACSDGGAVTDTAAVSPVASAPSSSIATRWVAVSVATVWTSAASPRRIDAPALRDPADPRVWIARMTDADKRDLVGRVQTQALYGTPVVVLGSSGAWSKIAVPSQPSQKDGRGYPGWVPSVQLTSSTPQRSASIAIVRSRTAWVYGDAGSVGRASARVIEMSYDTRLPVVSSTNAVVEVAMIDGTRRAVARNDVLVRSAATPPTAAQVLADARGFEGIPYLWGGTSGFGYDCSGLVYSVYHVGGVTLARDADRQALDGSPVPLDSLRPGDLLFVADATGAIVHDAMYAGFVGGVASIIESPHTGLAVRIVPLPTHRYVAARRVLDTMAP